MKRYEIYKNIRQQAMIYGLRISLFALMMLSVIGSLLVIIFSFSLGIIIGATVLNLVLYVILTRLTQNPHLLYFQKVFPEMLSNKKSSGLSYED